jgi:hypothetical protein
MELGPFGGTKVQNWDLSAAVSASSKAHAELARLNGVSVGPHPSARKMLVSPGGQCSKNEYIFSGGCGMHVVEESSKSRLKVGSHT